MGKKIYNWIQVQVFGIMVVAAIWVAVTSTIQRFKCDEMTETQLFERIPKSFVLDFKHCSRTK